MGAEDTGHLEGGPGQADLTSRGFLARRRRVLTGFGEQGRFAGARSSGLTMVETMYGVAAV